MNHRDLTKSFINIIFLLIFSFFIFILVINFLKFINYVNKVNNIIKIAKESEEDINVIQYSVKHDKSDGRLYNYDTAYTAKELGYTDAMESINGSEWGNGINLLLIGSDKRRASKEKSRSDVIIVLRINKNGRILSISIPRDTLVRINEGPWFGSNDKIGHSLYWGGLEDLKNSIEGLLASPIYRVIIVDDFRDIEAFLAIMGGIKIDKYLYGKLGVQWIRNRNFKDGDIERCKRQQIFLKKFFTKAWKMTLKGNYFYINFFYSMTKKLIYTDMTKEEFLNILYVMKKNDFNPENDFLTCILPGNFGKYDSRLLMRNDLDCWILNERSMKNMQFIFYSETNNYKSFFNKRLGTLDYLRGDVNMYLKNKFSEKKIKQTFNEEYGNNN